MSRRNKLFLFGGVLAVLVLAVVLSTAARRERAVQGRLEPVSRDPPAPPVPASGRIVPKSAVDISADITGRIVTIPVKEGQMVTKGTLLLRIDPSQYEAAVARAQAMLSSAEASALQARANRDQAQRALDRANALKQTAPNLVSDEQLEQAQTQFDVAQALATSAEHQVSQARAGLREAQDALAKKVLRSPIDGQVTRVAVEEGEVAVPGTFSRETGLLMTVSDLSVIIVKVQVDETDVVRLHMGDSADITIDAFPDTSTLTMITERSLTVILAAAAPAAAGTPGPAADHAVEGTLDRPPPALRPD